MDSALAASTCGTSSDLTQLQRLVRDCEQMRSQHPSGFRSLNDVSSQASSRYKTELGIKMISSDRKA